MVDHAKIKELAKEGKKPLPPQGDNTTLRPIEGLLSPEDYDALRAIAREKVVEEYKEAERKLILERLITEERGKVDPEEDTLDCLIDLPGHSAVIKINMKPYWHGVTYNVPVSVYRTLIDIMAMAWRHEEVVKNVNQSRYQPVSRGVRANARTLAVSHANVLHA